MAVICRLKSIWKMQSTIFYHTVLVYTYVDKDGTTKEKTFYFHIINPGYNFVLDLYEKNRKGKHE